MSRSVPSFRHHGPKSKKFSRSAAFAKFRAVLSAYIVDEKELAEVSRELKHCVAASHDRAVSMLHYLSAAQTSGLVTEEAMRILAADIQSAVNEAESRNSPNTGHRTASPEPARVSKKPDLVAGRYEICSLIGKGGIGEVYLARDLRRVKAGFEDPRVAIKIIQRRHGSCPDAIRSLQREAVNAQCLVHRGIRRVYELGRHRQRFFIVMEWLDGETLATRLDRTRRQPMTVDAFRVIFSQVASALSFAHEHGIVHGDIKPDNVFMTVHGHCKLLDFGHTDGISSLDHFEPFAITKGYSSLEVYRGAQPEIRDDVYSLAAMAYRMLVGRRPFGRYTAAEAKRLCLKPDRPPMLSPRQWRTLRTSLSLHREDRLDSIHALCNGLVLSTAGNTDRPKLVVAA